MDPFSAPEIGDPRAIGSKNGPLSATSTDVIYPVSKLVDGEFQPGRTLEFNFKSDAHRHVNLRNSRLFMQWEIAYGEVNETASETSGANAFKAKDGAFARPASSLRMTALPGAACFDSQVRFTQNAVTLESVPNFYTQSMAHLLTTTNIEGTNTSGSNMLTSLRKDSGTISSVLPHSQAGGRDSHSLTEVSAAEFYTALDGTRKALDSTRTFGDLCGDDLASKISKGTLAAAALANGANKTILLTEATGGDVVVGDVVSGDNSIKAGSKVVSSDKGADGQWTVVLDEVIITDTIATGTELSFAATEGTVDKMTVDALRSLIAVKTRASADKSTVVNPKHSILQQGYSTAKNRSFVSTLEPLMLSTWQSPFAIPSSDFTLSMTVSSTMLKDLLYDTAGAYGCGADGAALGVIPGSGDIASVKMGQIYVQLKECSLHLNYQHPIVPFIPKSVSIRYNPMQVSTHLLTDQTVNLTQIVPPSTRSVYLFMRQRFNHVCADREELSKAAAGIVETGESDATTGRFKYFSSTLTSYRDGEVDSRNVDAGNALYDTQPLQNLQIQLGSQIQPREQLAMMDPTQGKMSRAWQLYTEFLNKAAGMRGSVMSFDEFCGYHSANFESGPRMGDRGPGFYFNVAGSPAGSLATDLQIRGQLMQNPGDKASQELVIIAVSDSLWNVGWQSPGTSAVLTETNPIV